MQQQIVKNSLGCRCPRAGIGLLPPAPALAGSAADRSALVVLPRRTPLDPAASSTTDGVAPPARPWHPGGRGGRAWPRLPFYRFFPGGIRCRPSGSGAPTSSGESTPDSSIASSRALLPRRRANPLRRALVRPGTLPRLAARVRPGVRPSSKGWAPWQAAPRCLRAAPPWWDPAGGSAPKKQALRIDYP